MDAAMKCEAVLSAHDHALVSVSGGADSDVMLDLVERVRTVVGCKVTYVFLDTGIEYRATREQLGRLEARYGVRIERRRAEVTIPVSCRRHGQPFLSKLVSQMMERLQGVGFDWSDAGYDELLEAYPTATSAVKWWCDRWTRTEKPGWYDISSVPHLRDFIRSTPPTFAISPRCCEHAKKRPARAALAEFGCDLDVVGVRKAEIGARSVTRDARCYYAHEGADKYRPLFWLSTPERDWYCQRFGVTHSDCYRVWGFKRTGCVGCPLNSRVLGDLAVVERYEPNMARAARRVFADSYAYTEAWHDYRDYMRCGMHRLF